MKYDNKEKELKVLYKKWLEEKIKSKELTKEETLNILSKFYNYAPNELKISIGSNRYAVLGFILDYPQHIIDWDIDFKNSKITLGGIGFEMTIWIEEL